MVHEWSECAVSQAPPKNNRPSTTSHCATPMKNSDHQTRFVEKNKDPDSFPPISFLSISITAPLHALTRSRADTDHACQPGNPFACRTQPRRLAYNLVLGSLLPASPSTDSTLLADHADIGTPDHASSSA